MIILNNKAYDIQSKQLLDSLSKQTSSTQIIVDWRTTNLSPAQLIDQYLPVIDRCHTLGYQVKVIMSLAKGVQFSQNPQPIVFCGHTYNPFKFDEVEYFEKS